MNKHESIKTILVVEDNPTYQYLIEKAFRLNGVTDRIHTVNGGYRAVEYLMGEGEYSDRAKFPYPAFIITDLKMPVGDGFCVLEHLKSNPEWAIIPTIVFSASNDPDNVKKAYLLGASSYHLKQEDYRSLCRQLKILHEYWMTCEVPEVDITGRQLQTESKGKVGERFPQLFGATQKRKSQSGDLA